MSGDKDRVQYYHRNVTAQLVFKDCCFLLDAESQLPGEGELACAMRLLDRVLSCYPKAFQVVVMDALYAKSNFFNKITKHGKDAIAVLKEERRELFKDFEKQVLGQPPAQIFMRGTTETICWDVDGLSTWPQVKQKVRVLRTNEIRPPSQCQVTGRLKERPVSSWTWVTTLSPERAPASVVVEIAHSRWCIENQGFNELATQWHANHLYKHAPVAILNFWLMSMFAYNIFRAFFLRNINVVARKGKSMLHFARTVAAELYFNVVPSRVPP